MNSEFRIVPWEMLAGRIIQNALSFDCRRRLSKMLVCGLSKEQWTSKYYKPYSLAEAEEFWCQGHSEIPSSEQDSPQLEELQKAL